MKYYIYDYFIYITHARDTDLTARSIRSGVRTRLVHGSDSHRCGVQKHRLLLSGEGAYAFDVYFVTALVPSDTACLASSPGRMRRTAVWISRDERVPFLL